MSETISIMFDEKGIAKEYDDTFDISIHCESEEEQNKVLEILNKRWIPVSEKLPEKDGYYYVSGNGKVWSCRFVNLMYVKGWTNSADNPPIEAWMPLPEPYKGGE